MVSEILKDVMAKRELTLQQLADRADIPLDTLRNIYYNKINEPKATTILKLSQALDLSMNYLCGDLKYKLDERRLIDHYRNASEHGKAVIRLFAQSESDISDLERNSDKHIIHCLIPIGIVIDGIKYNSCDSDQIETDNNDAFLAIEITTNNFAPAYCAGDRILLENRFPSDTEMAAAAI